MKTALDYINKELAKIDKKIDKLKIATSYSYADLLNEQRDLALKVQTKQISPEEFLKQADILAKKELLYDKYNKNFMKNLDKLHNLNSQKNDLFNERNRLILW